MANNITDYKVVNGELIKNTDVYMSENFYDEICHVLTDYEEGDATANDLYSMLVEIQNGYCNCH